MPREELRGRLAPANTTYAKLTSCFAADRPRWALLLRGGEFVWSVSWRPCLALAVAFLATRFSASLRCFSDLSSFACSYLIKDSASFRFFSSSLRFFSSSLCFFFSSATRAASSRCLDVAAAFAFLLAALLLSAASFTDFLCCSTTSSVWSSLYSGPLLGIRPLNVLRMFSAACS